jgi:glycosyltransferase involved in cell wall biosynthesis
VRLLIQWPAQPRRQLQRRPDIHHHHISNVFLRCKRQKPLLEPAEGHRDIGMNRRSQRLPRVAVQPRGEVHGHNQRSVPRQAVHLADQPPYRLPHRLAGTGPQEGIHDQVRRPPPIYGAPHRAGRVKAIDHCQRKPHPLRCVKIGRRIPPVGVHLCRENDLDPGLGVVQVASQRQPIPAVVPGAAKDEYPRRGHLPQHVQGDISKMERRVLHQHDRWNPVAFHRETIDLPHRLTRQDVGRGTGKRSGAVRPAGIIAGNCGDISRHRESVQSPLAGCTSTLVPLMPAGFLILMVSLTLASAALLVFWGVGLIRLVKTQRHIPTLRSAAGRHPQRPGRLCIIVPAHNEEASIRPLIESLRAQDHPDLTVLLCLDRCTDNTAGAAASSIGGDPRFSIVEINSCPEDWAGKVNAAWQAAGTPEARTVDFLLFLDADTVLDPGCISAALVLMEERDLDLLSVLSTLTADRWFEQIVQPAVGLELLRQYPILRANRRAGAARRAFANGQFMLFRRIAYDAVGGHQAVHDELLEDIALARRIARADRPAGLVVGDGMVTCRMYESWDAFRRGWKRIYTEAARCDVNRLRRNGYTLALTGAVLPTLAAATLLLSVVLLAGATTPGLAVVALVISSAALAVWLLVIGATYRLARVPLVAAPASVVGAWLGGRILLQAAADLRKGRSVQWGGRDYVRQPR